MLQFLRILMRRAPLLAGILLIWILTAVLALAGRGRGYKNYSTRYGRLPGVSVVMRGIHDHVMPWTEVPGDGQTGPEAKQEGDTEVSGGQQTSAAADREDSVSSGEKETAQAEGQEPAEDAGDGDGNETDPQTAKDGQKEASAGDAAGQTEEAKEEKPAVEEGPPLEVPESSCSKVVGAKDYGVADKQYLSPSDAVYNTDKEGLFAPNGTYYSLQKVEDNYFKDALFIGDSRTVGLYEYGGMEKGTSFLARESTTVYGLLNDKEKMDYSPLGKKKSEYSMVELLSKTKFRKIYISVGVNELGIPDTMDYYKEFRKVVEKISSLQPGAVIYIQGIMHVSKDKSKKDRVFNNTAIVQRNQAIATLANGRSIFYIDMNGVLCDEDGNLKKELTGDGIHLKASACDLWHRFLLDNAIVVPD